MKTLFLIFAFVVWLLAAPVLKGTRQTQVLTINHTAISETDSYFFAQIKVPRAGTFIDSAKHIALINATDTTRIPRWIFLSTDTIYLSATIAKSSTIDKQYRLAYSKSFNEVNSASAATNAGMVRTWLTTESTGNTLYDIASGTTATRSTVNVTFGNSGIFGSSVYFPNNINDYVSAGDNPIGSGQKTIALLFKVSSNKTYHTFLSNASTVINLNATGTIYVSFNNSTLASGSMGTPVIGQWYSLVVTKTAAGICNAYVNGVQIITNSSGGTPTVGGNLAFSATTGAYPMHGHISNVLICNNIASAGCAADQYKMLFTPSLLYSVGPVSTVSSGGRSGPLAGGFKSAFKSAYK